MEAFHPPLPLVLTMGEPAGIGPDLIVTQAYKFTPQKPVGVYADPALLAARARLLGCDIRLVETDEVGISEACKKGLAVIALKNRTTNTPGAPSTDNAPAVIESIERAVNSVHSGHAGAVVTAPIMKDVLYRAGFNHPGHTEFLAELAERLWGRNYRPVMMIWSDSVAVIPVTVHIPLSQVPSALTADLLYETALIAADDLRARFGILSPRLAVAGLNPHAGENGALGDEEMRCIIPALQRLQAEGINAVGPLPADTMFHARARQNYDVALCMYHDQALAPAKALAFDEAVNVTLGLPFIRTSPDHGTACSLAGTGRANPSSFLASLSLAQRLAC